MSNDQNPRLVIRALKYGGEEIDLDEIREAWRPNANGSWPHGAYTINVLLDALRSAVDEAERLRAENEKLIRERDRWQWCVDEGMRATNFCFPEDWENEKPYAAFYHAQHLVRQQLEKYMPKDKETPHV